MNTSLHTGSRRLRLIGLAVVALLALSACGSSSGSGSGSTATETQTMNGIVGTRVIPDFATVLTDAKGDTLYMNDAEVNGTIHCVDGCATNWPPLPATASDVPTGVPGITGTFTVVTRPDGTGQLALDGKPLYTFAQDSGPGSFTGDGFQDDFQGTHFVWHAVTTTGSASSSSPSNGGGGYGSGY